MGRMGVRCIIIGGEYLSNVYSIIFTYKRLTSLYPSYSYRASTNTLVIELTPTTRPSLMFWEEASMLGQVYANILLPPSNSDAGGGTDMYADVDAVVEIMEEYLGRADPRGVAIGEAYRWGGEEDLGGLRGE